MKKPEREIKYRTFDYCGITIYHEIKPRLKHAYIRVEEGRVYLKSSSITTLHVEQILSNKLAWIKEKLSSTQSSFNSCLEIYYFGEKFAIDEDERFSELLECFEKKHIYKHSECKKCHDDFFKKESFKHILPRVEHFSSLMKLHPAKVSFRTTSRQWGSCNSKRHISLNTSLVKLPHELIDYVIVHELSHLQHMNHSKDFHDLTQDILPNAKELRKRLKSFREI